MSDITTMLKMYTSRMYIIRSYTKKNASYYYNRCMGYSLTTRPAGTH